ncbi:MAG: deoxyribodipyrimidine photo-lyase [Pelagibacteraceae bacterium TMED124]|nr:deoxyribodipyrimidine photolyase [Candidatus Neomarinimicrobiota bacterium]RPG19108.1 MAG: deoxyribodipyrimidine photo-lyase [Pelagibacteraceae bacterium TMED124]|tara:strand:- start:11116 stop:12483 length:1368 start_codon:yes stop_codon:yes gene_type:complete
MNLVIFKNNLRLNDNPALYYASKETDIIPIYIDDNFNIKKKIGSASKYWLHHALNSLNTCLNNNLQYYRGNSLEIISELKSKYNISKIFMEKTFTPDEINLQKKISVFANKLGIDLELYNCSLLWEPKTILKKDMTPYKVFSPFYRKGCLQQFEEPDKPLGQPNKLNFASIENETSLDKLDLLPKFDWHKKLNKHWRISERDAMKNFKLFIENSVNEYKIKRDFPYLNKNSSMSPYIRFGMISIHRMWWELQKLDYNNNVEHYKSELGWREFSYYLLYHFPYMEYDNFQSKFDSFEWNNSKTNFEAWKKGATGFPIIDAGMKELWETGFIHNRIRMVVGSFLVKNLLIDWRKGEQWFWDCLVDADYASNIASWQWVAGTGADAAPYFRIFNPILQGYKFDSEGIYTLKYLPELKNISKKNLQTPKESNLKVNYPDPIIDYKQSRQNSLQAYNNIK